MNITFEQDGIADRNVTIVDFKDAKKEDILFYIQCVLADLAEDVYAEGVTAEDIIESWDHRDHNALLTAFAALRKKTKGL